MRKKIAIFCGGPSSEYEVSLNSAKNISQFINKEKYEIYFFYISKKSNCKLILADKTIDFSKISANTSLVDGLKDLSKKKMFALLAGIHGEFVEDGKLQTLLEYFQIPFSGSDASGSSLAMDKYRSSLIISQDSLLIPKTEIIHHEELPQSIPFPFIVKPNALGSSVGVFICQTTKEFKEVVKDLRKQHPTQELIIQEYIQNAVEISCGTLEKKDKTSLLLPPIEIVPQSHVFFDYDAKYTPGGAKEITPPISISKTMSHTISHLTFDIHKKLGLKVYSRSDFLIQGKKIYYLETNTLPGMTKTSLVPQEAEAIGIGFTELIDFIIENS